MSNYSNGIISKPNISLGNPYGVNRTFIARIANNEKFGTVQIPMLNQQQGLEMISPDNLFETYNPVNIGENEFYIDYAAQIIHFNTRQVGQRIVFVAYDMGEDLILDHKICTLLDNNGNPIETLKDIIEKGFESIDYLNTIGSAIEITELLKAEIENGQNVAEDLQEKIIIGENTNTTLTNTTNTAKATNATLTNTNNDAKTTNTLLNNTIENADDKNKELKITIVNGNNLRSSLEPLIANAKKEKEELEILLPKAIKVKEDTEDLIENGGAATTGDVNKINHQLNNISKIKLAIDIVDTDYKVDDGIDTSFLKSVQVSKLSLFYRNLRTGVPVRFCHRGDSLTFGLDSTSSKEVTYTYADGSTYTNKQSLTTYPEAMENMLKKVYGNDKILPHINRGRGGDWASISLTRHNQKHNGDITILMLGTNDSKLSNCPYNGNVEEYLYWMEQIIIQELLWEKPVVIFASPINKLMNDINIDTFSNAIKLLACKYCIPVVDTQELLNGYSGDIWSDNTHFTEKGYKILGTRSASAFVAEGLLNPNNIKSGDVKEVELMTSNIVYTDENVTYSKYPLLDSPPHDVDGSGYCLVFKNTNGRVFTAFYTQEDNMHIIPSAYIRNGGYGIKMTLDNGLVAENTLDSSIFNNVTELDNNTSYIEHIAYDTSFRTDKRYYRNNIMYPLRVANKGWHILEIQALNKNSGIENPINLFGFEFISFNNMYSILEHEKTKPIVIYEAGLTNEGTIPRPNVGDTIFLTDDITKYTKLHLTTGNVSNGTLVMSLSGNIDSRRFIIGDIINALTIGNTWIGMEIIDNNQVRFTRVDNSYPLRDIQAIL